MDWIKHNTPKNSVIWTWWDYGYAFQLYARRATIHDGGSQASPKTYLVAKSFAVSNPEQAWRVISFTANYGLTGLAKLLKEGKRASAIVEDILAGKFDMPINTPIYVVFTDDLISKFGWIHYFGSYDFNKKEGTFGQIISPQDCKIIAPNVIQCADLDNATLDLANGIINIKNGTIPIKDFYFHDGKELKTKHFFENGDYVVELVRTREGKFGLLLLPSQQADTLFNRMFILRQYDPRYFELVYDNFPISVIYRVKPE
jgi:dolichyl-diphosphooligosaccharide--protein glycosyltransferase